MKMSRIFFLFVSLSLFSCDKDAVDHTCQEGLLDDTIWTYKSKTPGQDGVQNSKIVFTKEVTFDGLKVFAAEIVSTNKDHGGVFAGISYVQKYPNLIPKNNGSVFPIDTLRLVGSYELEAIFEDGTRIVYTSSGKDLH